MARFHLIDSSLGRVLVDRTEPRHQPLRIDFANTKLNHRRLHGGKKELLLRAVDAKPGLRVQDWTAGLATDSFLLAAAGCEVMMFERSRVVAALLEDALSITDKEAGLATILKRMHLRKGDARQYEEVSADVIYLDPMFPSRKKTALVNGPMQYLQRLLGPDYDAEKLIQHALRQPVKRVVIKRPRTAPAADATFTLAAKANRFDVYERPGANCN